ncbi:basigin isoform X2 [Chironomus tepperi]|uniref:basigin isoform X2 n=1 Tax=Chironomus tepperi TaxID=113505 RepID=UPI00391F508A
MEKKIQYSLNLLLMLFIAFTVVSGELEAVYDNGQQYKIIGLTKSMLLACKTPDPTKIVWKRGEEIVTEIKDLNGHFTINEKAGTFLIERFRVEDAGNYSCNVNGESKNFIVSAKVLTKIPENTYVVEGDKLEIHCIVKGDNAEITWHYSNGTDSLIDLLGDDRIRIDDIKVGNTDQIESSRLTIDHVLLSDKGTYYCNGTNAVMTNAGLEATSSDGLVRIKGKLAALWPFLGICAEVFILCAIILIYEKRRNKTDLDESDTDQSPDQLK